MSGLILKGNENGEDLMTSRQMAEKIGYDYRKIGKLISQLCITPVKFYIKNYTLRGLYSNEHLEEIKDKIKKIRKPEVKA